MPLGTRVVVNTAPIAASLGELQKRTATLKAVRDGIKIVNVAAKNAAPKKLGHLRRAQGTKAVKGRKGKTGSFAVQGAKTKYQKVTKPKKRSAAKPRVVRPAFYDHLVLGGTKPHGVMKGGGVRNKPHPGARANPYRRQAYESVKGQVARAMLKSMGESVQKMIKKNAAKLRKK